MTAPVLQGWEEPRGNQGGGRGERKVLEAQGEGIPAGVAGRRRVDLTGRRDACCVRWWGPWRLGPL